MSTANDLVIRNILTGEKDNSSVHLIDWHIEEIVDKSCNNYFNKTFRLRIRYRQQKEDIAPPRDKTFFIKEAINTPFHDNFKKAGIYYNEVLMYKNVLPQMYTLETNYFTPKQYYFDDKMSLWLEDLTQTGYKCADLVQKLDIEHCIYALRCLAKFHALSVKLENTVGLPDSVKINSIFTGKNGETPVASTNLIQQIPPFIDSIPQHLVDRYPNLITSFKNLSVENIINSLNVSSSGNKFNVLNHGDFQMNNIMFKYDNYGTVEKVKLIDFQLTTWASPAYDLMYFFITSMKFEDYIEYFPILLKVYVNTLNKVLRKLDCPVYDMQTLLNDIDATYLYVLYAFSCLLPYIVCSPDELNDIKDEFKNGKSESNCMAGQIYEQKSYREILATWFEHFAKNGCFAHK